MKIVLTYPIGDSGLAVLRESGAEIYIANSNQPKVLWGCLRDADALIARMVHCGAELIEHCPRLKVIGLTGVGHDSVDVAYAAKRGIPVVYTPGINQLSTAEHVMACMLALSKNLLQADEQLRTGSWQVRDAGRSFELAGKRVGIVGFGATGQSLAPLCSAIGMRVAAYTRSHDRTRIEGAGVEFYGDLDRLLAECDVISLHVPLTEQTRGMIGPRELGLMKPTALFINCSRGQVVQEQALADALNAGRLAGAAVDVFSSEPVPPDHPLLHAKNLLCTPHAAGLTREAVDRMAIQCALGCLAVCRGERWEDVVDPSAYHKAAN